VPPGGTLTVSVHGFPANAAMSFQAGPQGDGYVGSATATTDASGNATATLTIPTNAVLNSSWIILAQTTSLNPAMMAISPAILISQ
jgi:hypothetical protein